MKAVLNKRHGVCEKGGIRYVDRGDEISINARPNVKPAG